MLRNVLRATTQERALFVFAVDRLPYCVRVAMADHFISSVHAGLQKLWRVFIERSVENRGCRHGQRIKQLQATPGAYPVSVFTPGVIQHIGLG